MFQGISSIANHDRVSLKRAGRWGTISILLYDVGKFMSQQPESTRTGRLVLPGREDHVPINGVSPRSNGMARFRCL